MTKARDLSDLLDATGDVVSTALDNVPPSDNASSLTTGTLPVARLPDGSITNAKLNNDAKVVKSASAPSTPSEGDLWYDTANETLKIYQSSISDFIKVSAITPVLNSISENIYNGIAGNLTLNGTGFLTSNLIVSFTPSGGSASTVTVTPTSDTSATVAVPSAIYNQAGSTVIEINVTNSDNKSSANISKTVIALPTGGTISSSGGYRYHTFTSSSDFVVPSGFSATADYLLVAGGGSGGGYYYSGGGGAGGAIDTTVSLTATTYPIVIGAGGAGTYTSVGNNGVNSTAFSNTAIGGGYGGHIDNYAQSGGSGGGSDGYGSRPGSGTAGQGNDGGNGGTYGGGGGGGKSSAGSNASGNSGGNGGSGIDWKSLGNSYAGGGGGGGSSSGGAGGSSVGGAGATNGGIGGAGSINTGSGGGGTGNNVPSAGRGGNGGSGIVIIRYAI